MCISIVFLSILALLVAWALFSSKQNKHIIRTQLDNKITEISQLLNSANVKEPGMSKNTYFWLINGTYKGRNVEFFIRPHTTYKDIYYEVNVNITPILGLNNGNFLFKGSMPTKDTFITGKQIYYNWDKSRSIINMVVSDFKAMLESLTESAEIVEKNLPYYSMRSDWRQNLQYFLFVGLFIFAIIAIIYSFYHKYSGR